MDVPFGLLEVLNGGVAGLCSYAPQILEGVAVAEMHRCFRPHSGHHSINALNTAVVIVIRVIYLLAHC